MPGSASQGEGVPMQVSPVGPLSAPGVMSVLGRKSLNTVKVSLGGDFYACSPDGSIFYLCFYFFLLYILFSAPGLT
jgi:hypothetical protein